MEIGRLRRNPPTSDQCHSSPGLRYSGVEHKVNQAIEANLTWTAGPELVETPEEKKGRLDEAIRTLKNYISAKPNSTYAYSLLPQMY